MQVEEKAAPGKSGTGKEKVGDSLADEKTDAAQNLGIT